MGWRLGEDDRPTSSTLHMSFFNSNFCGWSWHNSQDPVFQPQVKKKKPTRKKQLIAKNPKMATGLSVLTLPT